MQGKVVSNQGTSDKSTAGIDVSKEWLDAHIKPCGKSLRVANDKVGIGKLKRLFISHNVGLVVVEATGKWHRLVRRSLFADGIPVAEVNPYRVRNFARATNILAKNDKLDAQALALFGVAMEPDVRPPPPEMMEMLAELVHGRLTAVKEQTSLKNQLSSATNKFFISQLKRRLTRIEQDIEALEKECLKHINADPALARRCVILTSIPGVGLATAITLIACLSELGSLNSKAITKLVGVAPLDDDSGKRQGRRTIWGGRSHVRSMAYMAAISASQFNPPLKAYYERLRANGKEFKRATIAVVRKLVILANLLVAENRTWQPQAPVRT